jgi:hypothetical protein
MELVEGNFDEEAKSAGTCPNLAGTPHVLAARSRSRHGSSRLGRDALSLVLRNS